MTTPIEIELADSETNKELAAAVRAGCFASEADAMREAVQMLFATKPQLRVEAAIRRYCDDEITLGCAAELAGMTRWRLREVRNEEFALKQPWICCMWGPSFVPEGISRNPKWALASFFS